MADKNHDKKKEALLTIKGLKTYFPVKGVFMGKSQSYVQAVNDIDLTIYKGETDLPVPVRSAEEIRHQDEGGEKEDHRRSAGSRKYAAGIHGPLSP